MYKEIIQDRDITKYIVSYNSFNFANGLAGSFLNILFFSAGNLATVIEYQLGENKIVIDRKDMSKHLEWVGVNYYSRDVVSSEKSSWKIVNGYGYASNGADKSLDGRSLSDTGWEVYPEGLYNLVMSYNDHLSLQCRRT